MPQGAYVMSRGTGQKKMSPSVVQVSSLEKELEKARVESSKNTAVQQEKAVKLQGDVSKLNTKLTEVVRV